MSSGEDQDAKEMRKKRYHRHTPRQIQELERMFKFCPQPDEKQRMQLSRDLGLEPKQIKFWFQNRRTQMKAQHERHDNCSLRAENDKIAKGLLDQQFNQLLILEEDDTGFLFKRSAGCGLPNSGFFCPPAERKQRKGFDWRLNVYMS